MTLSICSLSLYLKYPFICIILFFKCKQRPVITSKSGRRDCSSKSWPVSYSSYQTLCSPHHTQRLRNNANVRSSYKVIAIISSFPYAPSTGSLWAAIHRISTIMAQIEGGVEKRWYSAKYVRTWTWSIFKLKLETVGQHHVLYNPSKEGKKPSISKRKNKKVRVSADLT